MNLFFFVRDIIKACKLAFWQIFARLWCVRRMGGSSICLSARLDVYGKQSKLFTLGKGSFVEKNSVINSWIGDVTVGNNTGIGINSIIIGPVKIGSNTRIAQNCFISGENRKRDEITNAISSDKFDIRETIIGNDVWIGAGVVILPGAIIEDCAVVGAGSVVTKIVPRGTTVVGNPARPMDR